MKLWLKRETLHGEKNPSFFVTAVYTGAVSKSVKLESPWEANGYQTRQKINLVWLKPKSTTQLNRSSQRYLR